MHHWHVAPALLVLCLGLGAAPERAIALEVRRATGAEACPNREGVTALLVTRLGYSPVAPDAADRVTLEFRAERDGLSAKLELARAGQPVRSRELRDPDPACGPLAAAAAFAIALAVDPQHLRATPEPQPPPAVEPPALAPAAAAPEPAPAAPPSPPVEEKAEPPIGWQLGIGGAGVLGSAPDPTAAVVLHGGFSYRLFSLGFEARIDVPVSHAYGSGTITTYQLLGSLVPCLSFGRFSGCAVASAGALRASSTGLVGSANLSAPMVALGGRLAVSFRPVGWLLLTPWLDVLASLTRVTLSVDGAPVWATPALAGLLGLRFSLAPP
ncbi:MAG: hypothetical protein IPJ65_13315 [Archangiaceae bacterium]|nr:hypothetical protein [Archangiaceae bacterium]